MCNGLDTLGLLYFPQGFVLVVIYLVASVGVLDLGFDI
jgi:hypothetical protein